MDIKKVIKSGQEQAVAAWVNYLNQVRLDRLMAVLAQQDANWQGAMAKLDEALSQIRIDIIGRNRGGNKGMHGFIAEVAECGIGNARQQIEGKADIYEWINDNGPTDILRGAQEIQQKFVQSGGHLSLQAIAQHLQEYPDYLQEGGIYQIPQDHYDKIQYYLAISEDAANKMSTSGEFSLKQWQEVQTFFANGDISIDNIEPSILTYNEVQAGAVEATFEQEKERLAETDRVRRDLAHQESQPSLKENAQVTLAAAAIEGAAAFCMAVVRKRKSGKLFVEFNAADWQDIAGDTGKGAFKGGVRGTSIYVMTNYTATPAAVASAIVTASFGVAQQVHLLRDGVIGELQFIENAELLCVDATVSALSSFVGQVLIPIPVLGAVIGNTVGVLMYQIAKDNFSKKEQTIINGYLADIQSFKAKLAVEYQNFLAVLSKNFIIYMEILDSAFSPDVYVALQGSADLAKLVGVPDEEILDSHNKILAYFMN